MTIRNAKPPVCPVHGKPNHRETCTKCMSAYMRGYLRRRRVEKPALGMWHRAKKRADRLGVDFSLARDAVVIPDRCPVLGVPLDVRPPRTSNSPSLDRIDPAGGYADRNVRVISDHANRIKGAMTLAQLRARAIYGSPALRADYAQVVAYVEREALLVEVRKKAAMGGSAGAEWHKVALFLDRVFRKGDDSLRPHQDQAQ